MNQGILFSTGECVLGVVLVATSERGVCAILLGDDFGDLERELRERFPQAAGSAGLELLVAKVAAFVAKPAMGLDVALDLRGSEFQLRAWRALQEIPAGSTETYGDVAERIGLPGSAKEVGEACAANMLAVAIPCHRVTRKDGGLAGYRWGVWRKRALLRSEGARLDATADLFDA
jgi:AraC family transcriptional regulator, regulatory protein of adaptative response / methylated-DNA-[protein]-cysteine methyltransferase